jgi:tyrosyl-tRNA synthetase
VMQVFEGIPQFSCAKSGLVQGLNIVDLLAEHSAVFPSKGEAKKMIQGGGVAVNKVKVNGVEELVGPPQLINDRFIVVQKGKKNYFLLIAE